MTFQKLDLTKIDWQAALPQLGIDPTTIANPKRLGLCPIEGDGNTRFRFVNKDGRGNWFCNACGSGDAVRLVALFHNVTDADAIRMVRDLSSSQGVKGPPQRSKPIEAMAKDVSKDRQLLQRVWDECGLVVNTSAAMYLQNRVPGFDLTWLTSQLAFHPSLYHFDEETRKKQFFPALVGRVTGLDGKPVTLHRTYLSQDGFKAPVSPSQVKKQMTGVSMLKGESIKLNSPHVKSRVAIVCEGIETGLALIAATKNRHTVFAALNAGNLAKFQLQKSDFDHCIICADKDVVNVKHGWRPGEHFAEILRDKLLLEGFGVKFRVPEVEGKDFADLWYEACKLKLAA